MSTKLKLGIINSSPLNVSYGGVGPFIKNLDPFLKKNFDVTYITLPTNIHDLKFPRRLSFLVYLLFKRNLINKQDIILSHVPEGSYVASFSRTPLVHIFHGNYNAMSQSRFWYGRYFERVFSYFEKTILHRAKLVYTVGIERPNVPKILNPILHSVDIKPVESRRGFVFVGRLEKIKNINKIIEIYASLNPDIRKDNDLFIAGTGSQEKYLKDLRSKYNLEENIKFIGELPNQELIEFLSFKKILLMASDQEGLPMAIAESLSVGIPVISTDTGDISRAVSNGYNGFLVPISFKYQEYIQKIEEILPNYLSFSTNALNSSTKFQAHKIAEKLSQEMKELLNNRYE